MSRILAIGLGNELRGDDAAGLLTARALLELAPDLVDVEEHTGDVVRLAESMRRYAEVVIVDAVVAEAPPGTVLDLDPVRATTRFRSSSHGLGVAEAIALARVLEPDPAFGPHVRVIGIAGTEFGIGSPPSAAVERAANGVAHRLASELRETVTCA